MIYQQSIQRDILKQLSNDYKAYDYETLSITSTAKKLTRPASAKYVLIQVESDVTDGKAIRYMLHGGVPTNSTGFFRGNADAFDIIDSQNITNARFIQGTSGTTNILVTYFK